VAIDPIEEHPALERSIQLLMVAALGIPLFTALRLFWEKSPWGRPVPFSGAAPDTCRSIRICDTGRREETHQRVARCQGIYHRRRVAAI